VYILQDTQETFLFENVSLLELSLNPQKCNWRMNLIFIFLLSCLLKILQCQGKRGSLKVPKFLATEKKLFGLS
jgi:hypothetical protein